jgi:hypothetical protein
LRSSLRGLAATVCTSVVAVSLPILAVLGVAAPANAAATGNIKITEWAYNGIEFFELTNMGRAAEDMTGWSYSDSTRTPAPAATSTNLSAFGRVAPGESVIVSELSADAFRTAWGLPATVKVIGGNAVNLGRSDEINIYDESGAQVDRLTYNDQGAGDVAGPRTDTSSAWVPAGSVGANTASTWTKSTLADAEGSWQSTTANFFGSPGKSTLGGYDAAANNSAAGSMRITEWAYNGIEFFELTNVGSGSQDMTGWSYSDSARIPDTLPLSAFGTVSAGESVIVSELSATAFRTAFDLDESVKVIGGNSVANLGRSDEINIYDAADTLVDRLTYNDQGAGDVAGPRTDTSSAWVVASAVGKNVASRWVKSTAADDEDSWASTTTPTFYASPGVSNFGFPFETVPEEPAETIRINEVESNGDVVGDWVELTNIGSSTVDVSGWTLKDNGESNPSVAIPSGTTIAPGAFYAIYTEIPGPGFGLGVDDSITLSRGATVVDSYAWSGGHAATTYGRCPDGTGDFRVTTVATRGAANACSPIRVNEVMTAGSPDQVEIVNLSASPVDISGWVLKDSTDVSPTTLASGSIVPANGYLVVTPHATLDAADSVRLFDGTSALIDSVSWSSDPTPSLGRCADGVGAFKLTETATIGAVNKCPGVVTTPWPGSPTVTTSDDAATFNQDASGLAFDPSDANTLWVAQNKLGTLWKMTKSGTTWVPAAGWSKTPKYNDGSGAPDSEGITVGPDGAVYLATERDNSNSGVSKNRVLRYDANAATGSTLNATDEWDINPLLPTLGANLGLEGITWIPDSFLVAGGFIDESTGTTYTPSTYPAHGTGLYAVAVEGTGMLYVLALDQTAAVQETAHLVATVDPRLLTNAGPPSVMDVSYDAEQKRLWAVCDDSCNGTTVLLKLDGGKFVVDHAYDRPAGMPNLNNEGFAVAPQSTCLAGKKEVIWSDDGDTDGHSLRSGTFPCDKFDATVDVENDGYHYGPTQSVPVDVTAEGITPTGTVTLKSGDTVLDTEELADGAATLVIPAHALAPGSHTLTVEYAGDDHVAASSAELTQNVSKALGSVVADDDSGVYGQELTIPVEVVAEGVTPTGTVTVKSGETVLGSADLTDGTADVVLPAGALAPGAHSLSVNYLGDDFVVVADDLIQVTVSQATSEVSATGGSVAYGQDFSVPVEVTADGVEPTGTVTVKAGDVVLGSEALSDGAADVEIPGGALDAGTYTLTVAYAGDDNVGGDQTTVELVVTKAATSAAAGNDSVVYGKGASIPVEVTADGVTPTGKVTVKSGSKVLGTATLSEGSADVSIPAKALAPGKYTLTVEYAGDDNVQASTDTATLTVTQTKSSLSKPSVSPRKVIVKKTRATVTVKVTAPGVTPTGKVTVSGGGLASKSVTIKGGKAVLKLAAFKTAGVKTLKVTYAGDKFVDGATTTVKVKVVKK